MSNLFLRFSSFFACVPVKLALGRTRKTVLAHIVREVYFEGVRIGFSLKYRQITKKNEPEKTKQGFVLVCFFWFAFLCCLLILQLKTNTCPFRMDLLDNMREEYFLYPFSDKFNWNTSKRR